MKIFFLGNNWIAWKVIEWLRHQKEEIVGLAVHPTHKQKYAKEIIKTSGIDSSYVFDGSKLKDKKILQTLQSMNPEIGISVFFGYVVGKELIDAIPRGCLNLHPALLPYNRGAYPNVWSIVEGTPAGASLHYMDEGIDTGDIVSQESIAVDPVDTGETLYHKLEQAALELFKRTWPLIRSNKAARVSQKGASGTYHAVHDVSRIDKIDLDRSYKGRELIDIIRARTFSPYSGAYFLHEGKKIYLRLELLYEDQIGKTKGNGTIHKD